jgi:response regulator of citrate/malate metabolism
METTENMKALIIDDSPYIHTLLDAILKKEGITDITHGYSGDEGIKLFSEVQPDIIFLDNIMPKTSGMEVLEQIRQSDSECKIIMISSMSSINAIEESKVLGANYYLIKPFIPEKIKYVLQRFLNMNSYVATPI